MPSTEQFLIHLLRLGVRIWEEEGDLRYSAPVDVLTPALYAELVQRKAEVLKFLRETTAGAQPDDSAIRPLPREGSLPLSSAQQRLWFLDQLEPNSLAYNVPAAYRLAGPLCMAALEQAINEIVHRHEVLRTTFTTADGEPVQFIAPFLHVPLRMTNLEALPIGEREPEALRLAAADGDSPFDLSRGPLLRTHLLRLQEEEHILVLTMHHIVTDGWSVGVFRRELAELYAAFSQGRPSPLSELPVQYADFAVWQRQWLQGGVLARGLAYWRDRLEGAAELELPSDRPRPALLTCDGARLAMSFSTQLTSALKALSQREGVTLFMTLLAAFNTLLYRYTGQEDIVVGTPIANRDRAEVEGLIGFFVNTLALRTELSETLTFRQLLAREREVCLEAYVHQHLPFEKLVEELRPQRDLSRNPLFQVLFAVQNAPRPAMEMTGLMVTPLDLPGARVRFDLECHLWEEGGAIRGALVYNTNLFDTATMERMAGHFRTLLEGATADSEQRLSDLPLLTEMERHQLLVEWNKTEAEYPQDGGIHQLFEAQVERTPDAVAVSFAGETLTYRELDQRANQLAHHLQKLGAGPDVVAGLCVERSLEMVTGLLGMLKGGAACLPLDPSYPRERLAFMLQDSGALLLLTQSKLLDRLPHSDTQVICLDSEWDAISQQSGEPAAQSAGPGNLAYVLYTSGSTGRPKGVAMKHRAMLNLITWQLRSSPMQQGVRTVQFTPLSFDVSFQEILSTLCGGGTLVLVSEELHRDPSALLHFLAAESVERIFLPFVALQQLASAAQQHDTLPTSLREVTTAGERLQTTPQLVSFFRRLPQCRLHNHYGPTETHVVTAFTLEDSPDTWPALPPIGHPIANTQVYVLDAHMQPVPIGVPGELYLGGHGLARGYLRRPELTAERFVRDPFSRRPDARLYRTGDVARYRPDGNIEFLGRRDDQIKMRGFRIELGEIETTLAEHPAVRQTAVLARDDLLQGPSATPGAERRLVAYVVAKEMPAPPVSELRSFLRDKLPEYMLPSVFVFLDAFPLTPSGKINRRALPAPDSTRPELETGYVAPQTATEGRLAEIWQQVLGVERVGIDDSFFDLGGHSLLAVSLFARIEKAFGERLPLAILFQSPTVRQLASLLDQGSRPSVPSVVPIPGDGVRSSYQPHGTRPPLFFVHPMANDEQSMGSVLCYKALARHLGADQPVYGLQPKGIGGTETPLFSIEHMARYHVEQMRAVCPEGPYLVGGYSYGGLVAYEMARQLELQHQDVRLVALLDTSAYLAPRNVRGLPLTTVVARANRHWTERIGKHLRNLRALPWSKRGGYVTERIRRVYRVIIRDPVPHSTPTLLGASWFALNAYLPQTYAGKVTLFRAEVHQLPRLEDTYGWRSLAKGGVEVCAVPGDHWSLIIEPQVQVLAGQLRACIDEALSSRPGECLPE